MKDDKFLIALSSFVPFGSARISLLKRYFGSYKKAWEAPVKVLKSLGLSDKITSSFALYRDKFDIDEYLERLGKLGVYTVAIDSQDYPANLKRISSAPLLLYVKGTLGRDANAIAIVGTRSMSAYGREVAYTFSRELARAGVTIVSGLARGIDTQAHKGALSVGGRTIAVLSSGLDSIYPAENAGLVKSIIAADSAVISEYPLGYPSLPVNFAMRNRIISGLSKGVLVVEGRAKSGTLLTAGHAAEQGVDVYVVPGSISSPLSEAPHFLLKNGAKVATNPSDILEDLKIVPEEALGVVCVPRSAGEKELWSILDTGPLHIDELVRMCSLETSGVASTLSMMEVKGLVKNIGGGVYKKV
jgi:DNA processing protein